MVKEVETPPGIRFDSTTNRKLADGAEVPDGRHRSIHARSPQLVSAFHENQHLGREGKHIDFKEEQSATTIGGRKYQHRLHGGEPKVPPLSTPAQRSDYNFPCSFLPPQVVTKDGWREAEVGLDDDHQSHPKSRLREEIE
ncbi:unnamed protein product [Urochloa humidicola]